MLNMLFWGMFDHLPLQRNKELRSAVKTFRGQLQHVISQRREGKASQLEGGRNDLLQLMLDAGTTDEGGLSDDELMDNLTIFFLAGHDTTSTALSMAMHLLAHHPDIQEKCREEVRAGMVDAKAEGETEVNFEVQKELPLITMVIRETLRMYPPVERYTHTDTHRHTHRHTHT
jgi:cytochrome P450